MLDALRQDWAAYAALTAAHDREFARSLTVGDRFARYEDLFDLVNQHQRSPDEQSRLDLSRWQQKLSLRLRQLRAFGLE